MLHTSSSRRAFLRRTGLATAATTLALATPSRRALGANDRAGVAVMGMGRGRSVGAAFDGQPDAEVVYLCDVDNGRLSSAAKAFGGGVKTETDFRRILDDKAVDILVVATPDHWHAPAGLLAMDAGKHVYIEKSISHNIREGRLLVEAAKRTGRVVQHGTQNRSNPMMIAATRLIEGGAIGRVISAKAWNIQRRGSIGHGKPAGQDPPGYDTWLGPAPYVPYQSNRFHGRWHWWASFGTGGMGNDGVHDIDYALMALGVDEHPTRVAALGGKCFFDDDQEFPDTQTVVFEYPGDGKHGSHKQLIYEQRLWSTNYPYNVDSGAEIYGTEGQVFLSRRGKIQFLGPRNRKIEPKIPAKAQDTDLHARDMLDAIRQGRPPNANVEIAHRVATVVHLGNIATRLGRSLVFDPKTEKIVGDEQADALTGRAYREGHWAVPKGV